MKGTVKITGGIPLKGTATPIPNKNSILAALPSSLLTNKTIEYRNVPKTSDVAKMLEILEKLGAEVSCDDYKKICVTCKNIKTHKIDRKIGGSIRASALFVGPLLARLGKAEIPLPGGCVLGQRSLAAHTDAFKQVGVKITFRKNSVLFEAPKNTPSNSKIWMIEASVTATENLCMYLAGVSSKFTIQGCACEPHVSELLKLLKNMGAKISGIGSSKLEIEGKKHLGGGKYIPGPDQVDIAGYMVAAAVTKGQIRIKNANIFEITKGLTTWFSKFNLSIVEDGKDLVVDGSGDLFIDTVNSGFPMASGDLPKLYPRPWPGFPADVLPVMVTLACKTKGRMQIQNWMYENGLDFTRELNGLGAQIFTCDPQRVIVTGPIEFKGGEVISPSVIQACKALFLAALADKVETTLHGVDILKRRYPDIFEVYKKLGANIEILE
ncbi:UDP-N-acetylglucosamine 1-carboxyvinyltransferase [Patescibacteria group bacterium]